MFNQIKDFNLSNFSNFHLDWLESEAIYIMREVASECKNPVLLFSGGKDSIVLLRIAEKAFRPQKFPFTILHIDTGHNFPEVISFRNKRIKELNENIIIKFVESSIKYNGFVNKNNINNKYKSRNTAQAITLLETINEFKFDVCIGGARRDEEKSRAKERIFSFRNKLGQWDPKIQRPELWELYNTRVNFNENIRVFPISNWTELDVWQYIYREKLSIPNIYFAHERSIIFRNNLLIPLSYLTPKLNKEIVNNLIVRFRTVGDISCTCPIISNAYSIEEIIIETSITRNTERGETRMDDRTSKNSMEKRKKKGYF